MLPPPGRCPACGAAPEPLPRSVRGHELRRCPGCGLRWWDFSSVDPAALYSPAEYFHGETTQGYDDYFALRPALERTARDRLRRIGRYLGLRGGRVLDVGCGPGFFLAVARAEGWEVAGIDVSEAACRYARDRLGLPVRCTSLDLGSVEPAHYDLVTLWDVLEHLPDPAASLRLAATALRPEGGLVLTTGDVESLVARLSGARWHLYNFPDHLYFHTPASVRRLLAGAGLRVQAIRREGMIVSGAYVVERIAKSVFAGRGRRLGSPLGGLLFPVNLGDVLTAYAVPARGV